ncbi:MAG: hypothetical protein IBJ00_06735 [Alphaproteobacteria bacterium]|nr:hypothetical protein [Alphaproteobacteria bacterium]
MNKTIYTLLVTTTLMPAIAWASTQQLEEAGMSTPVRRAIQAVESGAPGTPNDLVSSDKLNMLSPFSGKITVESAKDEFRQAKAAVLRAQRQRNLFSQFQEESAKEISRIQERYVRELAELNQQMEELSRNEETFSRSLIDINTEYEASLARCETLESEKAAIEAELASQLAENSDLSAKQTQVVESRQKHVTELTAKLKLVSEKYNEAAEKTLTLEDEVRKAEHKAKVMKLENDFLKEEIAIYKKKMADEKATTLSLKVGASSSGIALPPVASVTPPSVTAPAPITSTNDPTPSPSISTTASAASASSSVSQPTVINDDEDSDLSDADI